MKGKLLVVIGSLEYGGTERHLVQTMPRLAPRGWQVELFTLAAPGAQAPLLAAEGIPVRAPAWPPGPGRVRALRALRLVWAAAALVTHLRRFRPDIVHFFLPQAYLVGAPCARLAGCRRLVMSRRSRHFYQDNHPRLRLVERWLHGRMAAVLGNAPAVIADLRAEGVDDARLGLIRNGIDPAMVAAPSGARAACRREFNIPDDALVLIKVANLIPYKGHADLIDALAAARLPEPWRVICVGRDQGTLAALRARAARAGLDRHIVWAGQRHDIARLLAAADIGVLCSHEEGFSNAVLEYMAAGLAVVATDVGSNAEAVEDGVTGRIVPPHDPAAFARAIGSLAGADLRTEMGAAGRARVASQFSIARCEALYDSLYGSLMRDGGVPAEMRPGPTPVADTERPRCVV